MRFIGTCLLAFIVASTPTSVAGTASLFTGQKASLRESCAGGRVLNTTTVLAKGHQVKMTTTSCPGLSEARIPPVLSPATRVGDVQKRQTAICGQDCTVSCDVVTGSAPFISDCNQLTNALEALFPQSLLAPAQTFTTFEINTCGVAFFNLDSVDMNYCYLDIGFHLGIISSHCFPSFDGPTVSSEGYCIPPQTPGREWAIEGYQV